MTPLAARLQQFGINEQEAAGILSRGVTGRHRARIWVEPAEQDRAMVGGFRRIEMMHLNENGNPVRYD